ncbi:uncharacterized protein LOC118613833 [Rousettus aegyptiacus]|uniref:Uncharacterized protein n=1 Tax=Rousettus aegyptiacus TaxID=9407 RepID=A0A7J8JH73_ROUAE|nr:uncharacterized protein LOC118613833 [Rousettus aegyptiacus]KAF6496207.1 hypothetical protein HJG63_010432 [Rousettus aegyptiacus]
MKCLLWSLFQIQLSLSLRSWTLSEVSRVSSYVGGFRLQLSPDARGHPVDMCGFSAVTCRPQGVAFLRAGRTGPPSSHPSGQQWAVRSQTGRPLASDRAGSCGPAGACEAPPANHRAGRAATGGARAAPWRVSVPDIQVGETSTSPHSHSLQNGREPCGQQMWPWPQLWQNVALGLPATTNLCRPHPLESKMWGQLYLPPQAVPHRGRVDSESRVRLRPAPRPPEGCRPWVLCCGTIPEPPTASLSEVPLPGPVSQLSVKGAVVDGCGWGAGVAPGLPPPRDVDEASVSSEGTRALLGPSEMQDPKPEAGAWSLAAAAAAALLPPRAGEPRAAAGGRQERRAGAAALTPGRLSP